jgi:hypothetical protein
MTQPGMVASRSDSRMVPSTGVHEPQREPWLVTHRTLFGFGTPPKYWRESSAARRPSSASPRAARRALRRSCVASRSSMIATQRCSSARDIRAGSNTIVRSPSRYADTVRRRRALRRTSTDPSGTQAQARTGSVRATQINRFLSRPQRGSPSAQVAQGASSSRSLRVHTPIPPCPQEHSSASPPHPQPCPQAVALSTRTALTAPLRTPNVGASKPPVGRRSQGEGGWQ